MDIQGTDFVFLKVSSFAKAEAFYTGVLGLPCTSRYQDHGGEFETGNLTISALEASVMGQEVEPTGSAIALRVPDVEAARAELEEQGVEFQGETIDSGVCLQAIFSDPDGNTLVLHRRYAPKD
jgi:predicted enzyme related to lactoylglutathione lyase